MITIKFLKGNPKYYCENGHLFKYDVKYEVIKTIYGKTNADPNYNIIKCPKCSVVSYGRTKKGMKG